MTNADLVKKLIELGNKGGWKTYPLDQMEEAILVNDYWLVVKWEKSGLTKTMHLSEIIFDPDWAKAIDKQMKLTYKEFESWWIGLLLADDRIGYLKDWAKEIT